MFSFLHLQAYKDSRVMMGREIPFRSFEVNGLLRGLDVDPKFDRFPHEFQIEFLDSVVPRCVCRSRVLLVLQA